MLLLLTNNTFAQPRAIEGKTRIEQIKKNAISRELSLSAQQEEEFWPIYNNYHRDLRNARMQFKEDVKSARLQNATDADAQKGMKALMDARQAELDLQKKYQNSFLTVISSKQLLKLWVVEKKFQQELLRRMNDRRQKARASFR